MEVSGQVVLAESGITGDQFAANLRPVLADSVTDEMLNELFNKFDADCDGVLNDAESAQANRTLIERINHLKSALLVIDFQNDFVSGSLAIKNGSAKQDPTEALVPLNRLLAESPFSLVVYTMDWHPYNHISFWEHCRNSDRKLCEEDRSRKLKPLDVVRFEIPEGVQRLYPAHCIQNSWGADLDSHMIYVNGSVIIKKGSDTYVDSYSAFRDNKGQRRSELENILRAEQIDAIFVCGLAYEICVAATANDGVEFGFLTALVADCTKGLDEDEIERVKGELTKKRVPVLSSEEAEKIACGSYVPWQWICSLCDKPTL